MRRILGHKWAVGAAALMLVFALGAISWAATEDTAADQALLDDAVAPPAAGFGMFGAGVVEGESAHFGGGHGGMRGGPGGMRGELTDEMKAEMEARRAAKEAQRDAFLDLVREKMTAEDQAALDELLGTADTQREALEQAREALRDTTSKIRDLIGTYFPLDGVGDDATDATTPEADGASL